MVTREHLRRPVLALLLAAALLASALALGQWGISRAAVTSKVLVAEADTRVTKSQPSANFGTSSTLEVDGSPVVETYLRFSTGSVVGSITRAVLRLYVTNGSVDGPAVHPTVNTWSETAMTWNNRPARTGALLADLGAVGTGTWVEFDVSAHVRSAGTYSFTLATSSTDGTTAYSRQYSSSAQRPQLVLTVDDGVAPDPSDTTPPDTTVTSAPSGVVHDRSVSTTFTSNEPGSTFECSLNGSSFTGCTSPKTYSGLADGSYAFSVRARDVAGNVDASPAAANWTVDGVSPTVETTPVPHSGDAADDPAIWINRADPSSSAVIGTDKLGGLAVYGLDGRQLQYLPAGNPNNVDVRADLGDGTSFTLGGRPISLVATGNRTDNSIGLYELDAATRQLRDVAARVITAGTTLYGACSYRSPVNGTFYVFLTSKSGNVEQWRLFDNGAGRVDAVRARTFDVGTTTEGCVADDRLGHFYVSEESAGVWKYGAEPGDGAARTQVAAASASGPLVPDVEGLAIAYGAGGGGYLIVSSQGNDSYAVFRRDAPHTFVKAFRVTSGNGIDGAEQTDGLDVTTTPLGSAFPSGLLVVQDGTNAGGYQNFKLVPYQEVLP